MPETGARNQTAFAPSPPAPARRRRSGALVWLALLFGAYCLLLGALLPLFAKPFLEHELSREFGVVCSIGRLTVHPLTWKIIAFDVAVPYPENQKGLRGEDLIRLRRLEASLSPASARDKALVMDELRLVKPRIAVVRYKDGSLSPQFLFAGTAGRDGADGGTASAGGGGRDFFPFACSNITLSKGTLVVRDEISGADFTVTDIDLAVPFASTLAPDREKPVTPSLSATVFGNRIAITGESRPFAAKPETVFTLRTRDFGLAEFRSRLAPYTSLTLESGSLHTELTLRFDTMPDKAFDFSLAGRAEITDLVLSGPGGAALKASRAGVEAQNVILGPRRVAINDFFLDNPELVVRRAKNGEIDWERFFFPPRDAPGNDTRATDAESAAATGKHAGLPLLLDMKQARVTGGKIVWHDATLKTPAVCVLENVAFTLTGVSTGETRPAAFSAAFGKDGHSFSATGEMTASPPRLTADVSLKAMPLAPFGGYATERFGLALHGGVADAGGSVAFRYGPEKNVTVTEGRFVLAGVRLRDARRADSPFLDLQRLEASSLSLDLAGRSLRVGKIAGVGVNAAVTRDGDGSFAFPAAFGAASGKPAGTPKDKASGETPWKISVDSLDIKKSRVSLTDFSVKNKAALHLDGIAMTGGNFANHGAKQGNLTLSGSPGESGAFSIAAKGALVPMNLVFSGKADKADLRPFSPYLQEISGLSLAEASLGGDFAGTLKKASGGMRGTDVTLTGALGLYGVSLVSGGKELGGWGRMRAEKLAYSDYAKGGRRLSIASLTVNAPRLTADFDENGVSGISKALSPPGARAKPPASRTGQPLAGLAIDSLALSQGRILYVDRRVSPPYALHARDVNATMRNVSLDPKKKTALKAGLTIDGSPLSFDGSLTGLFASPNGKGAASIRSLNLSRFTRYSEKYLGHPIRRGEMNADISVSIKGEKLAMRNKITISNLDLGPRTDSPGVPNLPLGAAAALLRDGNGDIRLDLPVSGAIGDPEFKIGGVVRRLIGNLALKTVTAPFTLIGGIFTEIGNLFSGGGPQSTEIVFAAGKDALNGRAMESLEAIGKELAKRRSATLEITGTADRGERDALVDARVDQALRTMKYNSLPPAKRAGTAPGKLIVSPAHNAREYSDLLFALYTTMPFAKGTPRPTSTGAVMRVLRQRMVIDDKELARLAQARAQAASRAVAKGRPGLAARIRIAPPVLSGSSLNGERIASYATIRVIP